MGTQVAEHPGLVGHVGGGFLRAQSGPGWVLLPVLPSA